MTRVEECKLVRTFTLNEGVEDLGAEIEDDRRYGGGSGKQDASIPLNVVIHRE